MHAHPSSIRLGKGCDGYNRGREDSTTGLLDFDFSISSNGIKEFLTRQMNDCNTAVNNAIRRIFTYNRWESTRSLREAFGYKSLTELFAEAKTKFTTSLSHHRNPILRTLSSLTSIVD